MHEEDLKKALATPEPDAEATSLLTTLRRFIPVVEASLKDQPIWPEVPYHHAMPYGSAGRVDDPWGEALFTKWEAWAKTLDADGLAHEIEAVSDRTDLFYREYFRRLVDVSKIPHDVLFQRMSGRPNRPAAQPDPRPRKRSKSAPDIV